MTVTTATAPARRLVSGPARGGDRSRKKLVTAALLLRFATILGASVSFCLLLPVVPWYAKGPPAGARPEVS